MCICICLHTIYLLIAGLCSFSQSFLTCIFENVASLRISEILCRLPVKPLLRFRCVSKGWCSLIDSNVLTKKHLKKTLECNTGSGLIINGDGGNFYFVDFDSLDDDFASAVRIDDPFRSLLVDSRSVGSYSGLIVCLRMK